jgi:hypothetical protein
MAFLFVDYMLLLVSTSTIWLATNVASVCNTSSYTSLIRVGGLLVHDHTIVRIHFLIVVYVSE